MAAAVGRALAGWAFRNYQVAAPLKRIRFCRTSVSGTTFRNYQVAAPLKRRQVPDRPGLFQTFRNYQVAAPLKQTLGSRDRTRRRPSATIKLRPH